MLHTSMVRYGEKINCHKFSDAAVEMCCIRRPDYAGNIVSRFLCCYFSKSARRQETVSRVIKLIAHVSK